MFRNLTLLFIFLLCQLVHAQEQQLPVTSLPSLADGYLLYGIFIQRESFMDLSDWRAQFPNSKLLKDAAIASNTQGSHGRSSGRGPGTLQVGIGLDLSRKENGGSIHRKQLRLGILHSANNSNQGSWSRSITGPYDTLTSQLSGEVYAVDTTWTERYSAYHEFSRLGFDLAFVLLNENLTRWSWQVGFGALIGMTLNDEGRVYRTAERRIEDFSYGTAFLEEIEYSERIGKEIFPNGTSFWVGPYAVLGFSRRLGDTHPFWRSLHLHYEARPTLLFSNFHGDVVRSMRAAGQHLLGLRVDLQ